MKKIFVIFLVLGILLLGCPQEVQSGEDGSDTSCVDSDGGKDIFNIGSATSPTGSGTDRCLDEGAMVMEYYCEDSWVRDEDIPCPSGYVCEQGECIELVCFDTDGRNPKERGSVYYNKTQYDDECLDEKWVREFTCDEEVVEEALQCGPNEKCEYGECVGFPVCTDSDNGDNVYVAGITRHDGAEYEDTCVAYNVVFEYSCENGSVYSKQIMCPEGLDCEDGICVEGIERECRDTDGGKSRFTRGTVTYWVGGEKLTERDKCYDQYSVLEVWCTEEGTIGFGIIECYEDTWCEDGVCTGP